MLGKLRRTVTPHRSLVLLGALLVVLTCLPGTALCIGSDGHLALEAAGSACGSLHADDSAIHRDATVDASRALHGCVDTPLGTPSVRSATDPERGLVVAVVEVPASLAMTPARGAWERTSGAPPLAPLRAKLSTVLLL